VHDEVLEAQLALLETADLQLIGVGRFGQVVDDVVEVAVFGAQAFQSPAQVFDLFFA